MPTSLMLPSNFFNRLDPIYCDAILKLEQEIEEIEVSAEEKLDESDAKMIALLNEFSSTFLMPKWLWKKKIEIAKNSNIYVNSNRLAAECIFHFSYLTMADRKQLRMEYLHDKKLYYCEERKIPRSLECKVSKENFCFPHANLEKNWNEYKFQTRNLIPRTICKKYKKMKKLYLKIKRVKNDIEKWFEAMVEAEDIEFVVQNVEFRLGQCLTNKRLWKLYINYLKIHDHQKLLETYSKYCRFFVSDIEMKEEYQKAAEKIGPSYVLWKNTFDFEIYDKNIPTLNPPPKLIPALKSPSEECLIHLNPKTAISQNFPFRPTLLEYIVKTAEATILHDLFQSCKWFYLNFPIAIIYNYFGTKWDRKFISGQKITTDFLSYPSFSSKTKLYFSSIFSLNFYRISVRALSTFIPKIHRFSATTINIKDQNLSLQEIKFFLGHGEVTDLNLSIKDQDGNPFNFEDILQFIPKIQQLDLLYTVISPNIAETLCNFPFQNKVERMWIGDVRILPDPYAFAEFILKHSKKNYQSRFEFFGYFNHKIQEEEKRQAAIQFENIVNLIVYKKWKGYKLPELRI